MDCLTAFISSYVSHLEKVDETIESLVEGVRGCLEEQMEVKTEIPLFLYATGGVRKLPDVAQQQLFASITNSHIPFGIQSKAVLTGRFGDFPLT